MIIPVALVENAGASMALLVLACLAFGIYTSNLFAITQTLAGPRAAGKWTSFQNGFGNFAGVLAPWLTGTVVDQTGKLLPRLRRGCVLRAVRCGELRIWGRADSRSLLAGSCSKWYPRGAAAGAACVRIRPFTSPQSRKPS